jgi:hypothetical protein
VLLAIKSRDVTTGGPGNRGNWSACWVSVVIDTIKWAKWTGGGGGEGGGGSGNE